MLCRDVQGTKEVAIQLDFSLKKGIRIKMSQS